MHSEETVVAQLICEMDQETVQVYDTIIPTKDGSIERMNKSGKDEFIEGKFFVLKRPLPANESANPTLKVMIKQLTMAINKYYAFGSPFSEEF